ncbi:MAG: TerB family tellurite resistance protein [Myxococcota bacterium]
MGRPRDFLDILEDPQAGPLSERKPGDELILGLLAHMFYADDAVTDDELAVFGRLTGRTDTEELREYLDELGERPLDYDELARTFPDLQDRDDIVTIAEHAIWGDSRVERGEVDMIEDLMEALGIKPG